MTEPENNTDIPDAPEEKPSRTTPAIERAWVRWVEERDEASPDQLIVPVPGSSASTDNVSIRQPGIGTTPESESQPALLQKGGE